MHKYPLTMFIDSPIPLNIGVLKNHRNYTKLC